MRWNIARAALIVLILILVGFGSIAALAWHREIAPVDTAAAFDPALIRHGAELASIGDCAVCHTRPDGRPFAGGLPIPTPFGTL